MSSHPLATYQLLDRQQGKPFELSLWQPVADRHSQDFEKHWRPIFDAHLAQIEAAGGDVAGAAALRNIQDAHWEWARKAHLIEGRLDWQSFAVEADGMTQGLMFVKTQGFAREPSQQGKPLALIELIATAPWNRPTLVPVPRFKGIGRLLLAAAISLSVHEEFEGRIGLHALPQAEDWYREVCGMTDLGVDQTRMRYFEMTEAQARAFLES
jgi:hypothetical protein